MTLNLRSVQELSKRKRVLSISRPAEARKPFRGRGFGWWRDPESNRGHKDFQSSALPTELSRRNPKKSKMQIFPQGSIGNLRPVMRKGLPRRPIEFSFEEVRMINCRFCVRHSYAPYPYNQFVRQHPRFFRESTNLYNCLSAQSKTVR